ncbi:hypothetical protein HOD20_05515 [archaeon]|mgnify:FL=1|jgi:hypothetical protein|nr:hypothetical protein [archaeon]MBT4351961.1 hypothetical protein [archaeon]MBT4646684.1 hypothetical protein [archaeon]MBT6821866.1 hypothetical protein [archaeon]MBT7392276.1 hypothetical protein [archaeon]
MIKQILNKKGDIIFRLIPIFMSITMLIIIIFIMLPYFEGENFFKIEEPQYITETVEKIKNESTFTNEEIKFSYLTENPENYFLKRISVKGFLLQELEHNESIVYLNILIDDDNNSILINKIGREHVNYFIRGKKSKVPYIVSGIFKNGKKIDLIDIISIEPSVREKIENVTQVKYYEEVTREVN